MAENDEIGEILRKIERGELSADAGLVQLNAIEQDYQGQSEVNDDQMQGAELDEEIARWKKWWFIPFSVGIAITMIGGLIMTWAFWFSWIPLLIGLLVTVLSWYSQRARWVHVRIRQRSGDKPQHIAFSLPIPLRIGTWFFRHFGSFIPNLQDKHLDDLLQTLDTSLSSDSPIYVHVNEDDADVQVYIG
jgi:hypothetical protein